MGWRIRKSINLGLGFRINLSKTGIGYSWGFPGYRITKMANGGTRTTYSLPGTGISYVQQTGKNRKNNSNNIYSGKEEEFKNIFDKEVTDDSILNEINKIVYINRLANILLCFSLLIYFNAFFILCLIFGIILKIVIKNKKVYLYYEFDDESRELYSSLKEVLIILSNSKRIWQINSAKDILNTKYSARCNSGITRTNAYITTEMPWYIKTNINIYGLNIRNQKMYFTPDRVFVFSPFHKVYGCTYNDMFFSIKATRFVESERVSNDAEIVDYAWAYSNRDGSRDLRFVNNRQFPVCKYGELTIKSPNGINTVLEFSCSNLIDDIQRNLIMFGNQFNKTVERNKEINNMNVNTDKDEKKVITNFDDIEETDVILNANQILTKENFVYSKYELPGLEVIEDDESKSIMPYIERFKDDSFINIPVGLDENDNIIFEKINSMPNMLIGGTVMSGKTSYINSIIVSLLMSKKPNEVKFMIFDSKKVDYSMYNGIPHLLCPIVTNSDLLSKYLMKIRREIEIRTLKIREYGVKSIDMYNNKVEEKLRYSNIIIFLDDISIINNTDEIMESLECISANGWNVNVHIIVAANHPSSRVISTVSKANFPSRLSFKVASSQASQIVLDSMGAEKLSGVGKALYVSRINPSPIEITVPYITDADIERIVNKIKSMHQSDYYLDTIKENKSNIYSDISDPMYKQVLEFVITSGKASASLLQRRFHIGYNRAASYMDLLEEKGIIGPQIGDKPRQVIYKFKDGE